jgi:CRISPR-associated protein Cmr5
MQTRDQKYASLVFHQLSQLKEQKDRTEYQQYGAMAHKLPILIRTAGLAQALAFVERGSETQKLLLDHLAAVTQMETRDTLLQRSREAHLSEYTFLTEQVMAALLWYKRFAQSVLGVQHGDEAKDEVIS